MSINVSFKLTDELNQILEERCKRSGVTKAGVLKTIISKELLNDWFYKHTDLGFGISPEDKWRKRRWIKK